jgi:hypothetical protein
MAREKSVSASALACLLFVDAAFCPSTDMDITSARPYDSSRLYLWERQREEGRVSAT